MMLALPFLPKHDTREKYLADATILLRHRFPSLAVSLPSRVRVSVGFPGGGSARKRIGEHWHPKASSDGVSQVFISPVLDKSDDALATLLHELIHACVPDDGHGKAFKRIATACGLNGPMRSTTPGESCLAVLRDISDRLGAYPHAKLNLSMGKKKQSTRLIKVECQSCGYVARTTSKWIEEVGAPLCPC
jgi:hypothetical protein